LSFIIGPAFSKTGIHYREKYSFIFKARDGVSPSPTWLVILIIKEKQLPYESGVKAGTVQQSCSVSRESRLPVTTRSTQHGVLETLFQFCNYYFL
jgi:hypothetical protein